MQNDAGNVSACNGGRKPVLSLIVASRNDEYMGNSRWRLETNLNYTAKKAHELGREKDVEVIVADWGSEVPLRKALKLTPQAARIVSFIDIPSGVAQDLQKDSPFSEVHALNAAARRVRGEYIGRICGDILVGKRFLQTFFEFADGTRKLKQPLEGTLIWTNRRRVPYRFAARCPHLSHVDRFIRWFGRYLPIDTPGPEWCFFNAPGGIWLLHRSCWEDCGGFDERLIYWGYAEIDMAYRLKRKYNLVHLEDHIDCDFYHLEHYHPRIPRVTPQKMNPEEYKQEHKDVFHPNGEDWGLVWYPLEILPYSPEDSVTETSRCERPGLELPGFLLLMVVTGTGMIWDRIVLSLWRGAKYLCPVLTWRTEVAWETVRGQPLSKWPTLLKKRWHERQSRQRQHSLS